MLYLHGRGIEAVEGAVVRADVEPALELPALAVSSTWFGSQSKVHRWSGMMVRGEVSEVRSAVWGGTGSVGCETCPATRYRLLSSP